MFDRVHEFKGFHDIPSKCHLRILDSKGKPIVVICSQMLSYSGTSITNAAEIIREETMDELRNAVPTYFPRGDMEKIIERVNSHIKEVGSARTGVLTFILESLRMALESYRGKQRLESAIWVEHYSADLDMMSSELYHVVTFDEKTEEPSWERVELDELVKITGYSSEQLSVASDLLDA